MLKFVYLSYLVNYLAMGNLFDSTTRTRKAEKHKQSKNTASYVQQVYILQNFNKPVASIQLPAKNSNSTLNTKSRSKS
jgi:hypothetical protein